MSEFDLIRRHFTRAAPSAVLGVGDDAALMRIAPGMELAVSTDMLVSGTHFFPDADPYPLGHKALAVNLSDMAAMGACPRWATLAIALPRADESWLHKFSEGFFALAQRHGVDLVGGDTTRGPLNLCVTIMGEVPRGMALRRDAARVGDDIWVSGMLGDAALALAHLEGRVKLEAVELDGCAARLHRPEPRIELGMSLRGIAHAAIDISDGLLADLGHVLAASGVGARIEYTALPVSAALSIRPDLIVRCALGGGDDYELCFTAPVARRDEIEGIGRSLGLPLARIGAIVAGAGCRVLDAAGSAMNIEETGYDHFN